MLRVIHTVHVARHDTVQNQWLHLSLAVTAVFLFAFGQLFLQDTLALHSIAPKMLSTADVAVKGRSQVLYRLVIFLNRFVEINFGAQF